MTFDAREKGQWSGQPIEGARFAQGASTWLYTPNDQVIILPAGTFQPEAMSIGGQRFSSEDQAEVVEIRVPRTNPVGALFIGHPPATEVFVNLYKAHRGEESAAIGWFTGTIERVKFDEDTSQAVLVAATTMSKLSRGFPALMIQTQCNRVLYGDGCGANPGTSVDAVTVTTVDGETVVSNDFALRLDQWFRGGKLVKGSESRFIVDHVGGTITLISHLPGLASLDVVSAYWGCDHLEPTCKTKFNALDSHAGFARIPSRNPYKRRLD